ncbi:MAG: hypothetical protein HF978_13075 [Desulfobacteraceae bacterium]|nr:hypothetical protein [Desulfobacteraceae bacterium]MBC2756473.1 hypothetical protein [Desulfobacteraceae bacterium]
MPLSLKKFRTFRWLIKLFKYSAIFLISLILLVSLILVFLPTAVSTDWSNQFIQSQISDALDRPVRIEKIDWSWKDGILISKLLIPDSPGFSEDSLVSLEHTKLKINVKRLLHRELNLEFLLKDLDIHIIKDSSGHLNIETLAKKKSSEDKPPAPRKTDDEKKDKKEKKPFVLPLDVSADIRLKGINLFYDDQVKSEKYIVKDLEITLKAPSVKTSPVDLAIGMDVQVNDQTIPRSTLVASVKNLFDADGALNIDGLLAGLDANLPGIVTDVRVDMAASDIKSEIRVDLAALMEVAVPLIPEFPSPTDIKGTIELTAATGTHPEDPMAFNARLTVADLQVCGRIIDGKSIGPGNFNIHLNGIMDLNNERLELETGDINILENSHINASGRIEQIKSDGREIHMAISPLYLDLNEITSFVQPFIPSSLVLDNQDAKAKISIKELRVDGLVPDGQTDIALDGLDIQLPGIVLTSERNGNAALKVSGTRLNLDKLEAKLINLFPDSAAFKLSVKVDEVVNQGESLSVSVSGIRLDHLTAEAVNIQKSDQSFAGIEGSLSLNNKLMIEQIQIPNLVQISDLEQSLDVRADILPDGSIKGALDHLKISTPQISVLKKDIGPVRTAASVNLTLKELFLKSLDPFNIDIKNFIARMTAEDAVSITMDASTVDTGNTSFSADIKINSDLNALTKKIPPQFLAGISGGGNLNIHLNAAGRRPDASELDALKNMQFTDNIGFIDNVKLGILADKGRIEIVQTDKNNFIIGSITASPLLAYELNGTSGKGNLDSYIIAGSIEGLPAVNPDKPISVDFSLSGSHDYAESIRLYQEFSVLPSGIHETIDATIDGLDRIITRSPLPELPLWISDMGAQITANVNIPDCRTFKNLGLPGLSGTDIDGQIAAGLEFHLVPDQSIDGGFSLSANSLNFMMPNTIDVEKINTNIDFSKSYQIQSANRQVPVSNLPALSMNVIKSVLETTSFSENADIFRHIRLLHERMNPDPEISIQKADIAAAPFPLTIGESMVMLNLKNGLPNLDYFQFNLLGGTMNGSVSLFVEQQEFYVNTALTFSGINTAEIFPEAFSQSDYSEADISGSLYADFPVTDELQTMLENAAITVEFTSIGSRSLERLLYALDPYENNEAIVTQRRILKAGSPKQIRLKIKDGFLSLNGEVGIKGIDISLPAIRRLNIAQVPGMDKFNDILSGLKPIILILQKISADNIFINKKTNFIYFE